MTPAKPAAQAPAAQPNRSPATPAHRPPLAPKGLAFAHVLAAHAPLLPKELKVPEMGLAQTAKTETALPQAIHGVSAEPDERGHKHDRDDDLDPSARQAAQLAPPMSLSPRQDAAAAAPLANARVSLEELVPQLVKKIAWSGDARGGTVRMELGAGELAGATLTVSAEHGRVSVRVDTPPGTDTASWGTRLRSRLEGKGILLDGVEVR